MVIIYILIQELDNSDLNQVPRSNPDVFHIISCQDIHKFIWMLKSCHFCTTSSLQSFPLPVCYEVS